ncbi:MAG TPA: threonine/serine dehydratase [Rhizomicrobium sp.]|nr:threonine/serine dehydratase [Rhizomicrobium sp.]
MSIRLPTFSDIEDAARRIAPWAVITPLLESPALNARIGTRVFLKAEPFQRTGSFKFRGACNRILLIPEAERKRGVVAFSSGNHAQGVAAAAALFDLPATIVMPADAPQAKIEGTRSYGAKVITYDRKGEDREAIARKVQDETGATLVKPFDDPFIVAGQGTAGLEMARQAPAAMDRVFVPASGGGLASGIALAFGHESPATEIFSVEPEGYEGMALSLAAGVRSFAPADRPSMADALQSPFPGEVPFAVAKQHLSGGVTVSDEALARAVSYAIRVLKIVVEPGGAAGLAAVLSSGHHNKKDIIGVVLSGGNADPQTIADCCTRFPQP